jgi:hypothetical protein
VTYSALQASHEGTGNITTDPLFVSASDFHLQSTSLCINAGVDVGLTQDYEGRPVPWVGLPSIGAYEYRGKFWSNRRGMIDGGMINSGMIMDNR